MPLPFFNRNQGNIRTAQAQIRVASALAEAQQNTVLTDVQLAYRQALESEAVARSLDPVFERDFASLTAEVAVAYARHDLSLLEYLDFMESYKNNALQQNQLRQRRLNAYNALELATGSRLRLFR
jgi:outer membrane protein, heavy metal efflux system